MSASHLLLIEYTGLLNDVRYRKNWRWKLRRLTRGIGGIEFEELDAATRKSWPAKLTKVTLLHLTPEDLQTKEQSNQLVEDVLRWRKWVDAKTGD